MYLLNSHKSLIQKKAQNVNINDQSNYKINEMDFFYFDDYKNIEKKKKLHSFEESNDRLFLYLVENKTIKQKLYNRKDFVKDYYFIKVQNKAKKSKPIGLIFPKEKLEFNFLKQQISSEMQNSPYIKDIFKLLKIVYGKKFELEELKDTENNEKYFVRSFDIKESNSKDINKFNSNNNAINNIDNGRSNRFNNEKIYQIKPDININSSINQGYNNKISDKLNNSSDNFNNITQLKNQISILKEENSKLIKEMNIMKNNNINYMKEINDYKTKLNQYINQINYLNNIIKDLSNKNKELENKLKEIDSKYKYNISSNVNNSILDLINHIEIFKKKLGFDLNKDDNLMIVTFTSTDQQIINHSFICKNNLQFNLLENMIYNAYPRLRENSNSNFFLFRGKPVNRFKTLDENGIKNLDVITLSTID